MAGNIRLYNTSGYVELQAPSSASAQVLELPTDSIKPALVHLYTETFSAVSSVSIDDVFSSTYQNYLLIMNVTASSTVALSVRMRASGSDDTGSNYNHQRIEANNTTVTAARLSSQTAYTQATIRTSPLERKLYVSSPQLAQITQLWSEEGNYSAGTVTSPYLEIRMGNANTSTQYDGFSLFPASGTMTGTVRVYGYRNS